MAAQESLAGLRYPLRPPDDRIRAAARRGAAGLRAITLTPRGGPHRAGFWQLVRMSMPSDTGAIRGGEALIIVDVQSDFCPGGGLAVAGGDEIIAEVNRLARRAALTVATRDWHPPDHGSFATEGGSWPVHCVRDTAGAELHPRLAREWIDLVIDKGQEVHLDGYSAFESTDLEAMLRARGVERLHVVGLALDYCVKHTALDARRLGFAVVVHRDATRAVDLHPGNADRAVAELAEAGVEIAA